MLNIQMYLNAYRVEQNYGGPEEGGWWYEVGEALACVPIETNVKLAPAFDHHFTRPDESDGEDDYCIICYHAVAKKLLSNPEEMPTLSALRSELPTEREHVEVTHNEADAKAARAILERALDDRGSRRSYPLLRIVLQGPRGRGLRQLAPVRVAAQFCSRQSSPAQHLP